MMNARSLPCGVFAGRSGRRGGGGGGGGRGGKFYIIVEIITKQSDAVSGKVVNKPRDGALFPTIIKSRFAFYASVSFPPVSGCPLAP